MLKNEYLTLLKDDYMQCSFVFNFSGSKDVTECSTHSVVKTKVTSSATVEIIEANR